MVEFSPGQYVTVRYEDVPRPYSISNPPTEAEIEICVRRVPGGRLTSELAVDLSLSAMRLSSAAHTVTSYSNPRLLET